MKTRSVLTYFPGYPFEPSVLTPSRMLAAVAGSLLDQGHETRILDFGTAETVARLVAGKAASHVERIAETQLSSAAANPLHALHLLWHLRCADRAFRVRRAAYAREIAQRLASMRGLHFAAFMINTVDDIASTLAVVRPLREHCPRLRIIAFGGVPALHGQALAREQNAFDCLCVDEPETTLTALAERADAPHLWRQIPNLVFDDYGRVHETPRETLASLAALPSPVYEPDTYPALRAEQKIRVFAIDECRPGTLHAGPEGQVPDAQPRVRPVASVCNEMWRIATVFGARAFHFTGEVAPASHVSAVAHELLRRGMSTVYTRASSIAHAVPATFPALYASGCVALSFPIGTGSQRLLDSFYRYGFTITDAERVLRCCGSVGMRAIARFTFPSAADDYHTRAETVRLLERARPHAAPIGAPGPIATDYAQRAVAERKFPSVLGAYARVHHAQGRNYEIAALHDDLVSEIERLGIPAALPEDVVRLSCIMGDVARGQAFSERVHHDFVRGDAMGIAALVDSVNEVACISAKRMALNAPGAERLAVGN